MTTTQPFRFAMWVFLIVNLINIGIWIGRFVAK